MILDKWNKKIYKNEDGSIVEGNKILPKELWEDFQIKSFPLFRNACYFHIPIKWTKDVREMLKKARSELGDKIKFCQIKEKFCDLRVYYDASDNEADIKMKELISECRNNLIVKDVHPHNTQL